MEILKVSSKSDAKNVAGAIAVSVQDDPPVKLMAIGAGAVNQTSKAIAIAKGYVAPRGIRFLTDISFATVEIDGKEKTAIEFTLVTTDAV